jgi:hypothetical protein
MPTHFTLRSWGLLAGFIALIAALIAVGVSLVAWNQPVATEPAAPGSDDPARERPADRAGADRTVVAAPGLRAAGSEPDDSTIAGEADRAGDRRVVSRPNRADPPPHEAASGAPSDTTILTGRVIDGETGRPLPGVRVALAGNPAVIPYAVAQATSDTDGRFQLRVAPVLPDDAGRLRVWLEDASIDMRWDYADGETVVESAPVPPAVRTMLGSPGGSADLGDFLLWRPGRITGLVRDDAGAPIAGAHLHVGWPGGGTEPMTPFGEGRRSDDTGRFGIGDLAPGEYVVIARAEGYRRAVSAKVDVRPAREAGPVILTLGPPPTLRVQVTGVGTGPIADARIVLAPIPRSPHEGPLADLLDGLADALYKFTMLPFERLTLTTAADGTAEISVPYDRGRAAVTAGGYIARTVVWEIAPGADEHEIEIALHPAASIIGRVVDRDTGDPVADAVLAATRLQEVIQQAATDTSDAAGRFRIAGLEPGTWEVEIAAVGGVRSGLREPVRVTLEPGGNVDVGDLMPEPAGRVVATVRDPDGDAVPGAQVTLDTSLGHSTFDGFELPPTPADAVTDSEGVVRFDAPVGRQVGLTVEADGFATTEVAVTVAADRDTAVEVTLSRGGTLIVSVVDGGRPVAARVGYSGAGGISDATTDAQTGTVTIAPLAPGSYRVWIVGGGDDDTTVQVRDGAETRITLQLPTTTSDGPPTISGRVIVAGAGPAAGARVTPIDVIQRGNGGERIVPLPREAVTTGPDGRYSVAARVTRLRIAHDGREYVVAVPAAGDDGAPVRRDVVLPPATDVRPGRIHGVVSNDAGPVFAAQMRLGSLPPPADGSPVPDVTRETRTDDAGAYGFSDLPPGRYRIEVNHPGHALEVIDLTLAPDATITRNVELHGVATLIVTVVIDGMDDETDSAGLRLLAVRITAELPGDPEATRVRTAYLRDGRGRVTFGNLRRGRSYSLRIESDRTTTESRIVTVGRRGDQADELTVPLTLLPD